MSGHRQLQNRLTAAATGLQKAKNLRRVGMWGHTSSLREHPWDSGTAENAWRVMRLLDVKQKSKKRNGLTPLEHQRQLVSFLLCQRNGHFSDIFSGRPENRIIFRLF